MISYREVSLQIRRRNAKVLHFMLTVSLMDNKFQYCSHAIKKLFNKKKSIRFYCLLLKIISNRLEFLLYSDIGDFFRKLESFWRSKTREVFFVLFWLLRKLLLHFLYRGVRHDFFSGHLFLFLMTE